MAKDCVNNNFEFSIDSADDKPIPTSAEYSNRIRPLHKNALDLKTVPRVVIDDINTPTK